MWNETKLLERLMSDESDFFPQTEKEGKLYDLGKGKYYIHRDRGATILGVAHLDTVRHEPGAVKIIDLKGNKIIRSIMLDDRLGVHVLMDILPKLGVKFDLLLTTGEEKGESSAEEFIAPEGREYNWMFSFDRHGKGAVMYDYETKEYGRLVTDAGFRLEQGSYSDICWLSHLGIAGFNFGVGYNQEHTSQCFAMWHIVKKQIKKFLRFYASNKDTKLINNNEVYLPGDWSKWNSALNYVNSSWLREKIDNEYAKGLTGPIDEDGNPWSMTTAADGRPGFYENGIFYPKDTGTAPHYKVDPSYEGVLFDGAAICPVCGFAILDEDFQFGDGMCRWCWDEMIVRAYKGRGDEWE